MALQKAANAQFLLQNKSQVLSADLLTAAPAAGSQTSASSPGRRSPGCPSRCLLHRKQKGTPPS